MVGFGKEKKEKAEKKEQEYYNESGEVVELGFRDFRKFLWGKVKAAGWLALGAAAGSGTTLYLTGKKNKSETAERVVAEVYDEVYTEPEDL